MTLSIQIVQDTWPNELCLKRIEEVSLLSPLFSFNFVIVVHLSHVRWAAHVNYYCIVLPETGGLWLQINDSNDTKIELNLFKVQTLINCCICSVNGPLTTSISEQIQLFIIGRLLCCLVILMKIIIRYIQNWESGPIKRLLSWCNFFHPFSSVSLFLDKEAAQGIQTFYISTVWTIICNHLTISHK